MRLFFAIDFEDNFKDKITEEINLYRNHTRSIKWINRRSLHLTLKFLGETSPDVCNAICKDLLTSFETVKQFVITTAETGFFPNKRNPRIFFLNLVFPRELNMIHQHLEKNLQLFGFKKENRKFHPHITLARIKQENADNKEIDVLNSLNIKPLTSTINEILLIQSKLTPSGARYTPVQKFSLRTK